MLNPTSLTSTPYSNPDNGNIGSNKITAIHRNLTFRPIDTSYPNLCFPATKSFSQTNDLLLHRNHFKITYNLYDYTIIPFLCQINLISYLCSISIVFYLDSGVKRSISQFRMTNCTTLHQLSCRFPVTIIVAVFIFNKGCKNIGE